MNKESLSTLIQTFEKSLFRIQTLPQYNTGGDEQEALDAYFAGTPLPTTASWPWFQTIRSKVESGCQWTNVHLLSNPLSGYLRFGIEWAYVFFDDAGAETRFVHPHNAPPLPGRLCEDFYLFDDHVVARMEYEPGGTPAEVEIFEDARVADYIQAAKAWTERSVGLRAVLKQIRSGELN